jgi:hypothetical protein
MLVEGKAVVTEADEVIHVAEDLWQEITTATEVDPDLGHAVLDDDVLSFGTVGNGLGRLRYRFVRHDAEARVHVFERIAE